MRVNFTANSFAFLDAKSGKCAQNILYKVCKAKTSKMLLNFTADSFVYGRENSRK